MSAVIAYQSRLLAGIGLYETDFDGGLEYWGSSSGTESVTGGSFVSPAPWSEDFNHDAGVGRLSLVAYRDKDAWEVETSPGVFTGSDFTWARVRMRMRFLSANMQGGTFLPWIQARHPGDPGHYANWAYTGYPLNAYCDGNWHDIDFDFSDNPALWTYAGGSGAYAFLPLDVSLRSIHNLHFPIVRSTSAPLPSGQFEIDRFNIAYLRNSTPPPPPPPPSGGATVVFDPPLNTASTGNGGYSFRGISSAIATGGTEVRVTFKASASAAASAGHAAIGVQSSGMNTAATPVELKFSGASGFSLAAGASIASDWMPLATAPGNVLVVVIDSTSSGQARTAGSFAGGTRFAPGTSFNVASPSGTWDTAGMYFGGKIEVRVP